MLFVQQNFFSITRLANAGLVFCFFGNNIAVDPEKGAVEIYCERRLPLYSMAVINLNCSLEFVSSLSIRAFCRAKSTKNARHTGKTVCRFFVQELQATSFSQTVIAT